MFAFFKLFPKMHFLHKTLPEASVCTSSQHLLIPCRCLLGTHTNGEMEKQMNTGIFQGIHLPLQTNPCMVEWWKGARFHFGDLGRNRVTSEL